MIFDKNLTTSWWALRLGLGLAAFLAGLDKFFNLLTNWSAYLSPLAERFLPFTAKTFMHIVGPIEMLVGLAILTRWTRIGAYAAAVWLLAIVANLVSSSTYYDLAVRDAVMAIGAYALANLTEARDRTQSAQDSDVRTVRQPARPVAAA
jgi:uncharacterized membrane protein YphA (DoxX/SURF4 family)